MVANVRATIWFPKFFRLKENQSKLSVWKGIVNWLLTLNCLTFNRAFKETVSK